MKDFLKSLAKKTADENKGGDMAKTDDESDSEEDDDYSGEAALSAAEDLIKAVGDGNAEAVVEAMRSLKEHC